LFLQPDRRNELRCGVMRWGMLKTLTEGIC